MNLKIQYVKLKHFKCIEINICFLSWEMHDLKQVFSMQMLSICR